MGLPGLWEMVIHVVMVAIVAGVVYLVVRSERKRRQILQQAIEANQPEVALGLIRQQWSQASMAGFACVGIGLALLAALVWHPSELAGLLLFAGILLCAGTPMALFGYLQVRADGRPGAVAWVAPAVASIVVAGAVFGVASRVHFGPMPSAQEARDFQQKVRKITGASPGTRGVKIDDRRTEPCLTGANYGTQGCGTPTHDGIRFETIGAGYLNVYYIPDTDQYFVIGRARVTPAGVTVEDDYISVDEALGRKGGSLD